MPEDILLAQRVVVRAEIAGGHRVAEIRGALQAVDQPLQGLAHLADLIVAAVDPGTREHTAAQCEQHGAEREHGSDDAAHDEEGHE